MIQEGRKRDAAANAVLALSFAANAAQSPQSLVSSGKVEAPGVANMQRLMDPRRKRKDLDLQRVAHSARNRKKMGESKEHSISSRMIAEVKKRIADMPTKGKYKEASFIIRKMKGKTFREFVEQAYLIEAKGQPTFSSRAELEKHHGGIPSGYYANNAGSSENPRWRLKPKEDGVAERKRREERIASLSSPSDKAAADAKKKKLQRAGLDAHHITPTHYSVKIKSSMSDTEWEERKKRDAADGIYHGNHPKNLMGATTSRTPEKHSKRGIRHRGGGAHELEGKTKDIAHVGHKGLLAAAHKRRLRKERESNK